MRALALEWSRPKTGVVVAVQQNKKTRSRRGMRRSHQSLRKPTVSIDPLTGETHLRHHMTPDGYYRGRQVIEQEDYEEVVEEEQ